MRNPYQDLVQSAVVWCSQKFAFRPVDSLVRVHANFWVTPPACRHAFRTSMASGQAGLQTVQLDLVSVGRQQLTLINCTHHCFLLLIELFVNLHPELNPEFGYKAGALKPVGKTTPFSRHPCPPAC